MSTQIDSASLLFKPMGKAVMAVLDTFPGSRVISWRNKTVPMSASADTQISEVPPVVPQQQATPGKYLYWKKEPPKSPWVCIPDTPEKRQKAIESGAMFFTWASLSAPYNGNGNPEPTRWGDMPLDFDCPKDIGLALKDLRDLCLNHLPEFFDIDPHEIRYFLSGGKGFHVIIPARLLNAEAGDPYLPVVYGKIAAQWKKEFNLVTLDLCLYNMKKGRMFRIQNVRRENGHYKVPLSLDEVSQLSAEELMKLGKEPRYLED